MDDTVSIIQKKKHLIGPGENTKEKSSPLTDIEFWNSIGLSTSQRLHNNATLEIKENVMDGYDRETFRGFLKVVGVLVGALLIVILASFALFGSCVSEPNEVRLPCDQRVYSVSEYGILTREMKANEEPWKYNLIRVQGSYFVIIESKCGGKQ